MCEPCDSMQELMAIMRRLRAPDGCPWDREQTHASLAPHLVEECYELLDALADGDDAATVDELGDVLLQVAFHCQIAAEEGRYEFADVARAICTKLRRRHPHVFGEAEVADAAGVVRQWDAIKASEKAAAPAAETSVLAGVPRHLPALARAAKLQRRAVRVGFDWPDINGPIAKLDEELAELRAAVQEGDAARIDDELGDVLFSVVNLSRFVDIDAEDSLRRCMAKFERRFRHVEDCARAAGRELTDCTLAELDVWWDDAKATER